MIIIGSMNSALSRMNLVYSNMYMQVIGVMMNRANPLMLTKTKAITNFSRLLPGIHFNPDAMFSKH